MTAGQIGELNQSLSKLRHDINGDLTCIIASAELIKLNPSSMPRMLATFLDQPMKIKERIEKFSAEFEKALGISRTATPGPDDATASEPPVGPAPSL